MGDAISADQYTPKQRTEYRRRLAGDLEIFDRYLQRAEFEDAGTVGLELELNLVDQDMSPVTCNREVLARLDGEFQSELGAYNVELNNPPVALSGRGLVELEESVSRRLSAVRSAAEEAGARVAMIGTLPTMTTEFLQSPGWMTPENRYQGLSNAIIGSRGEMVRIEVSGREHFAEDFADIAPESTCTSVQLHLQVPPNRFADAWNASQAIAGIQVALAANSPLFCGYKTWAESRIPVFRQSIDTRTPELVAQGVRPRVWFGERWITSIFDLFEENVRYFSPLLPEDRQVAGTPMMRGETPAVHYLNLHNGTVWRWNRPIYAPGTPLAHLRVENRLLPAGPTVTDTIADAAFYYGLVNYLTEETRPVWSRLTFPEAFSNFQAGARSGLFARQTWPTIGSIDVAALVRDHLLSQARTGLERLGADRDVIDYYLDIIAGRVKNRQNGAHWQLRTLDALCSRSAGPDSPQRRAALAEMLELYLANQDTGKPVHTWPIARA